MQSDVHKRGQDELFKTTKRHQIPNLVKNVLNRKNKSELYALAKWKKIVGQSSIDKMNPLTRSRNVSDKKRCIRA